MPLENNSGRVSEIHDCIHYKMFLRICQEIRYIIDLIVESYFNEIVFNKEHECKKELCGKLILTEVFETTVRN